MIDITESRNIRFTSRILCTTQSKFNDEVSLQVVEIICDYLRVFEAWESQTPDLDEVQGMNVEEPIAKRQRDAALTLAHLLST